MMNGLHNFSLLLTPFLMEKPMTTYMHNCLINNPSKIFSLLLYIYNVIMNVNHMKGITIMNSKKVRIVTTILYGLTVIGILVKFNMSIFTESIVYLLVGLGGLFLIYTEKDNKLSWTGGVIILLGAIMTLLPVIF